MLLAVFFASSGLLSLAQQSTQYLEKKSARDGETIRGFFESPSFQVFCQKYKCKLVNSVSHEYQLQTHSSITVSYKMGIKYDPNLKSDIDFSAPHLYTSYVVESLEFQTKGWSDAFTKIASDFLDASAYTNEFSTFFPKQFFDPKKQESNTKQYFQNCTAQKKASINFSNTSDTYLYLMNRSCAFKNSGAYLNLEQNFYLKSLEKNSLEITDAQIHLESPSYCNLRFRYCLDIPKGMYGYQGADNTDGYSFKNNQNARLKVWGMNLVLNAFRETSGKISPRKVYEYELLNMKNVQYKYLGKDFFVISGKEENAIYYRRTMFGKNDTAISFVLAYPESQKMLWEKPLQTLSSSLRFLRY